jgi:hypothetical protein
MNKLLKENFEQKIKEARSDERSKANKKWREEVESLTEAFEKEYELMSAEYTSKIASLEEQLGSEKVKSKEAREVYYFAYDQVKKNLDVASQMKIKISMMFEKIQEIYQDAITIFDRAEMLHKDMDNADSLNRDRLQLPHLKQKKK